MELPTYHYHFSTYSELTAREKSEALSRGFPFDAVFKVKRRYADNDWTLLGWLKGNPVRDANGIIRKVR